MASSAPQNQVVLITGASTGIGLALAKLLKNDSRFRVIATARKSSLSRFVREQVTESDRFLIRPLDITSAHDRDELMSEINDRWGGVDILVNNAGISYRAVFEHMTAEDIELQFRTNFLGPMELVRLVLPKMRNQRRGRIINVSSVGGMMAMPTMSAYSASKFALEGASESLWYEMKPWNVKVSLVQPGFVHSQSFKNVLFTDESEQAALNPSDPYHAYYTNMATFVGVMMKRAFSTPEKIASTILKVMTEKNPPMRVPATLDAWIFGCLRKLLPRGIYHRLLYMGLPGIRDWARLPEAVVVPKSIESIEPSPQIPPHEPNKEKHAVPPEIP